jgi:DNA-directed RNA polymerase subunit RPC12/RpoP
MSAQALVGVLFLGGGLLVAVAVGFGILIWNVTGVYCPACNGRGCWSLVREKTVGVRRIKKLHTFRSGYSGGGYGDSYTDSQGHYHSGYVRVSGTSWHQQQVDALRYDIDQHYECSACSHKEVYRVQRDSLEFEV